MRTIVLWLCALATTGCIDRMILDGTLKGTRDAASAFDTLSDVEVAKLGAGSSLVQVEGMLKLAPDNEDALFLLLQGWTGYAGAFIEDGWEQAYDRGDDDGEAREAKRAREAYERAIRFGRTLLDQKKPGLAAAMKNHDALVAWLKSFQAEDAETLLWFGAAWLSRVGVAAEDPALVADLWVAVPFLERSVELNPKLAWATGLAALGAYHARAPDAELAEAKALFERALQLTGRKALMVQLMYAQNYACNAHDAALYRTLLDEVVNAPDDLLPEQRLETGIAKTKARRDLGAPRLKRCGFPVK